MKNIVKIFAFLMLMVASQAYAGPFQAVGDAVSGAVNTATNVVRDVSEGAANVVHDVTGTQPENYEAAPVDEGTKPPVIVPINDDPSQDIVEPSIGNSYK